MITMDPKENEKKKLQVVVRIRPQQKPDNIWVTVLDKHRLRTFNHRNVDEALEYDTYVTCSGKRRRKSPMIKQEKLAKTPIRFEHVFGPSASQEYVYQTCVRPLLTHVMRGQNASVIACGPTGSGKTYTVLGCESAPGIIPRCVQDIFSLVDHEPHIGAGMNFKVSYSYLEIYNEKIYDLLDKKSADLPIRQNRDQSLFVDGLSEKEIESSEDFNRSFLPALRKRMTAATKLNSQSSRSHAVLLVKLAKTDITSSPCRSICCKIYIVDLAGSEDNRRTGNEGIRLKESGAINTSLFMLAEVVDALNKGKSVVPYRQSKLTRLLQDSLGGNSHSVMVVNVAPEEQHFLDTASTLKLARKSKKIVNTIGTKESTEKSEEPKPMNLPRKLESKAENPVPVDEVPNTFFSPLEHRCYSLEGEVKKMKLDLESIKMEVSARSSVSEKTSSCHLQNSANDSPKRKVFSVAALADIGSDSVFDSPLCLPAIVAQPKKRCCSCAVSAETFFVRKVSGGFDADLQRERKCEVLRLLNGSLQDLRTLQRIGEKRARLVFDWRALNGRLFSVADLKKIPGFTCFKSFMQANLLDFA